jgi:hypothetical protein
MIEIVAAVVLVLVTAAGSPSVSIYVEQEKGVSASDDIRAANQACQPNQPR